jgi:hypothetical protein
MGQRWGNYFINSPTGGEGTLILTSDKSLQVQNSLNLSNLEAGVYKPVVTDGSGWPPKSLQSLKIPELKVNM